MVGTETVEEPDAHDVTAKLTHINSDDKPPNPLSKKQLKKLKKREKYNELRMIRRARDRERQKEKRRAHLLSQPSRKILKRLENAGNANPSAICVAIDLDYDDLMSTNNVAKCVKQCLRIYTINRRSTKATSLHFTGIKTNGSIHAGFNKNNGWKNWNVKYHFDKTHTEVFNGDRQLVYLTSESNNVLTTLQQNCVYVIGGLVDHNHLKGLCHERAQKAGLATARLPLSEHVSMQTRSVLSTCHVFEILLRVNEGKTWLEAILQTIPSRKGAKRKHNDTNNEECDINHKYGINKSE